MPDVVLMAAVVVLTVLAIAIAWRPVRAWIRSDLADGDRGIPPAAAASRRAPTCCASPCPTRGRPAHARPTTAAAWHA